MTITFYLGKDFKNIREKFDKIKKYYIGQNVAIESNSDLFRYIVNLLSKEIERIE